MKIPNLKGEHSCKCTELSLKRKEWIIIQESIPLCTHVTPILQSVVHTIYWRVSGQWYHAIGK